jgi:molecular chaperone DnaJ
MSKDYYKILGVEKGASKEDIKKSYKNLAKKYHPDISKESDAEIRFKEINEAAGVLLDDEKRKMYDTYGTADGPQGFGGGFGGFGGGGFNPEEFGINLDDIFEQFGFGGFSGFGGRSRSRRQRRDTRVYTEIQIDLDDVYFGKEIEITVPREKKCEDCDGKGAKNADDVVTCDACGGSGFVTETQRSILGMVRTQRPCNKCHGKGNTIKNPYKNCDGNRTIREKESLKVKIPSQFLQGFFIVFPFP